MAEKLINIAGKLHAATTDGIVADSEQINYGSNTVKQALDDMNNKINDIEIGEGGGDFQTITTEEIDFLFQ